MALDRTDRIPAFSQWLRQRRKALGLTQKELAQRAGCAEVTLRKIEAGTLQPAAPLVTSLAQALGAADDDLPDLISLARGTADDFTTSARLLRPQRPNNLPAQLTPLIGRSHDITVVRRRLLSDGARLITLVGPPGVGKTRLSLAVAEDVLEQFDDGAFFVRLGPISDAGQVAAAIAQTLGLQMTGPNPPELQLRAYLEEKHLLLVLDNFEQIVAAAPLVDDLLRRCPWLHVLVTSRQPLRVRGERQIHVLPLALPAAVAGAGAVTASDMLRYPSVELFAERAEAVLPDFAVDDDNATAVAELCRRLDGLPLAIELVAARVKLLPPHELLQRLHGPWLLSTDGLRDVSARQKTLRGAIGWSYDLLTPVEQVLFTRLSVFVGGCTLEAGEMMCEDVLSPAQVLDGISSLLDKSLLHRETGMYGGPRYAMLETVREYGLERLALTNQEPVLRERHANCIAQLAEKAELSGPDFGFFQVGYFVDDEIHNMRAALAWAPNHDLDVTLRLTAPLLRWLRSRGPFAEAKRLMGDMLHLSGPSAGTIPQTKTLLEAGFLMLYCHEVSRAQAYLEQSRVLSRELRFAKGEADALLWLGHVFRTARQDQDLGGQYLEQALSKYRGLNHAEGISITLVFLAEIAIFQADYHRARILSEESLAVAKQAGYRFSWALCKLGDIALAQSDLDLARSQYGQALEIERQRGGLGTDMSTLLSMAEIAIYQRDFSVAHTILEEGLARTRRFGSENYVYLCICYRLSAILAQAQGDYSGAVNWYRASLPGLSYSRGYWSDWGLGLAGLAAGLNQHKLAAKLLSATEASDVAEYRLMPIQRDNYNRLLESARTHLGAKSSDAAWAEGREHPFEQQIEEAVSILEDVVRVQDRETSV